MPFRGQETRTPPRPLTVSELNVQARTLLEARFANVWVQGEVSRPTLAGSGHLYFALKDREGRMDAVMWARQARALRFDVEEGQQVLARGCVTVYPPQGRYQLVCDELRPFGAGDLRAAMLRLKARLEQEGLLDPARKRPLPRLPRAVGLVTSATGAAVHDLLRMIFMRFPPMRVVICPVRVQGQGAAAEIAAGIARLSRQEGVDVLVVGRGGGSQEDLWAFNEEIVARAIVACQIPIVSAVGHEIDVTIADLVSDLRAATPSAAGEAVVPELQLLLQELDHLQGRQQAAILRRLRDDRQLLEGLRARPGLRLFPRRIDEARQALDDAERRCLRALRALVCSHQQSLDHLTALLNAHSPGHWVREARLRLEDAARQLVGAAQRRLEGGQSSLSPLLARLAALNPLSVLGRGYSVTRFERDGSWHILRDASSLERGDEVVTTLASGPDLRLRLLRSQLRSLPETPTQDRSTPADPG